MKKPKATKPKPTDDGIVVHEFRPLPDRSPEEQVKALTQIVHQMSQNCFEVRLELNDLREQNVALKAELVYLRGITDEQAQANYRNLMKN
jgi:hypothetical protein